MPNNMIAILGGHRPEELGLLPDFIDQNDPRPAREQFDANYQHGGGWHPIPGFENTKGVSIAYPGDKEYHPIAMWPLRGELIVVYRHSLVAIFQTGTGDFEVARLD
jgi:hypothetical protein